MKKVVIVGGGIIGCATARFLSEYNLDITVLESGDDVSVGASKANSGILHAGYDCEPGSVKAEMNVLGLKMYPQLAEELDIPYKINGSLVLSFDDDLTELQKLYNNGIANGVQGLQILTRDQVLALEPNLSPNVKAALHCTTAGIISPYEATIAFAENAAENGVKFCLNAEVIGGEDGFVVSTTKGNFVADILINTAGVNSGDINNLVSKEIDPIGIESILPQRGQYYLLDNTQRDLARHTIFQMPTHLGKGVLVAPTVDGNVLIGPTAENIADGQDTATSPEGLSEAFTKAGLSLKHVPIHDKITNFAGVRAKHEGKDFILNEPTPGFINAIGIDSPGLTSAPAIARRLADMAISRAGTAAAKKAAYHPRRKAITRFRDLSRQEQAALIKQNPDYGKIVCRCETITEAEIIEAIKRHKAISINESETMTTLDAIKRRTRARMGRCQGGFCTSRMMELIFTWH